MSKELPIALCLSLAFHAAVMSVCPAPRATSTGENGAKQEIVVLGIVELSSPPDVEVEQSEPPEPVADLAEAMVEDLVEPDTAVDPDPLRKHEEVALLPQEHKKEQNQEPPEKIPDPPADIFSTGQEGSPGKEELSQGQIQDIRSRYLTRVMRQIEKAKRYPPLAYRQGLEGTVEVAFTISRDGNTGGPTLRKSSGHNSLDAAARDMITRAAPFEPLPPELNLDEMDLIVPVAFRIEETQK